MVHDIKEMELMQSRMREVREGSKTIAQRLQVVSKTELELERAIQERDVRLQKMKEQNSVEIDKLKVEIASMKRKLFTLGHALKVSINRLRTVARQKEFNEFKTAFKKWAPFEKATKNQTEKIVRDSLIDK